MKHFYRLLLVFSYVLTVATSYAANPVLISPADRSSVNVASTVVIKTQANDALAKTITIKILLNDPRKQVYETKQTVSGKTTDFILPANLLKANQQYLIELKTLKASGQVLGQMYYTIFTVYIPTIEAKPLLVSPTDTMILYNVSTSFGLSVNANNPRARSISVNFEMGVIQSRSTTFALPNALEATKPFTVAYNFNATGLQYNVVMQKKLVLTTKDTLGNVLSQNTYSIPVIIRTPQGPQFISPAPNAVGVSTTPTIITGNYSTQACIKWVFTSYEIDRYPADWQGADYVHAFVPLDANQWTPPVALQPNTKYQVRVYGGWICYAGAYFSSTFTTGSKSSARLAAAGMSIESETKSIIAPNPFSDEFSIQLDASYQKATVKIVSMQGRVVFTKEGSANESILFKDKSLAPGLYLVHISDQTGKKELFKVIKQ